MPDVTSNSHRPPEDRFIEWVDALVDPAGAIPVPDAELAELAGTAAFVQRAAGPGSAESLSPDRTESMWEEIMHATPTPATFTPTLPAGNGGREIASRALPKAPNTGWRIWLPTALLIAAISIAGFAAAWRIAGPFDLAPGGNGSGTANQPGVAVSATPAATSCDLTNDMLVFVGEVPEAISNLGMTYVQVEPDSDFVIACPDLHEPEPLLTGVVDVVSLPWPGTVILELVGGAIAYDIATGEWVDLGADAVAGGIVTNDGSPWLLTPNNAAYTDWRITNLETMASMTLSEEIGGLLPAALYPGIASNPDSPYGVLTEGSGWYGYSPAAGKPADRAVAELQESALVVDETLTTRRWIDSWGQVAVGDGAIAYQTQIDGQPMIRVDDPETGDVLAKLTEINFNGPPGQRFAVVGDSVVYVTEGQLWMAAASTQGSGPVQMETGEMQALAVYPTGVPGRVLVEWNTDEAGAAAAPSSLLNAATGDLLPVEGLVPVVGPGGPGGLANRAYFLTIAPSPDSEAQTVARLTDIVTGEVVLTSEPIDATVSDLLTSTRVLIGTSGTGAIAVVNSPSGDVVVMDATTDTVATIAPPGFDSSNEAQDLQWSVMPSHDGLSLYAIGLPRMDDPDGISVRQPSDPMFLGDFAIAPVSSNLQWSAPFGVIPAGTIPGIPTDDATDPAVLEAQDFAIPEPVATASPVAEVGGCDLDADISVVTGSESELPGTVLRLVDGSLTLECDKSSSIVAEGVAEVIPGTNWPGAVLLHMDDASLRGINLITGAEGDFGPYHDMVNQQVSYTRVARWMVIPMTPEQIDWQVIDLEMMESFLLSDELGDELPHPMVAMFLATTPEAAVIGFPGIPVIAGQSSNDSILRGGATPPPATPSASLPSDTAVLVIDGSLDNRHWTNASSRSFIPVAISPDSELLALEQEAGGHLTVRVERLADGELVADTDIDYGFTGSMAVLNDGAGLLHVTQDRIDLVTWSAAGETTVRTLATFETTQDIPKLAQTTDPNVFIVGVTGSSGESVGYLVDTASGDVTEMPGLVQSPFDNFGLNDGLPVGYVLFAMPNPDPSESTVQMYDVVTQQPVLISDPVDITAQELAMAPAALRGDVGFVFLTDGRTVVLDAAGGDAFVIEPPEDLQLTYQMPSPSGEVLAVGSGNAYFVRAVEPNAEWIQVSPESQLWFLPGRDDQRR